MCSVPHPWNISSDVFETLKTVGCANASYAGLLLVAVSFSLTVFDVGYITNMRLAIFRFAGRTLLFLHHLWRARISCNLCS